MKKKFLFSILFLLSAVVICSGQEVTQNSNKVYCPVKPPYSLDYCLKSFADTSFKFTPFTFYDILKQSKVNNKPDQSVPEEAKRENKSGNANLKTEETISDKKSGKTISKKY